MQIKLKVIGQELFFALSKKLTQLPHSNKLDVVEWQIDYASSNISPTDFLSFTDFPSVILIDGADTSLIMKIQQAEAGMLSFIKKNPQLPIVRTPVIFIFDSPKCLERTFEIPDCVSDWMFAPIDFPELARRIFLSLRRQKILKTRLEFGSVTLMPETNTISYQGKVLRLPASEFTLAELFFSQMGMVIPFKDLVAFFKSKGKSSEANNIRVAIYQLRLKLEMLTKSQMMLVNVYRKGYCLRQRTQRGVPDRYDATTADERHDERDDISSVFHEHDSDALPIASRALEDPKNRAK
jgi:DNA-binding response OmpR family regulator